MLARWRATPNRRLVPARLVPFIALIVVIVFFSITGGTRFLSVNNALFLIQQSAVIAIPASALTEANREPAVWIVDPKALTVSTRGIEILRRGYNFTDGSDGFGHLDAGLFFIAFGRNPLPQVIPMQALSEMVRLRATRDATAAASAAP